MTPSRALLLLMLALLAPGRLTTAQMAGEWESGIEALQAWAYLIQLPCFARMPLLTGSGNLPKPPTPLPPQPPAKPPSPPRPPRPPPVPSDPKPVPLNMVISMYLWGVPYIPRVYDW
jgi:hypothetical protein